MSIAITSPVHGAILNRHDGVETDVGLEIEVKGTCPEGAAVSVNGHPATTEGTTFKVPLRLYQRENMITAQAGEDAACITVLFNRGSFKRYRFSLDDDIFFLRDIAAHRPKSLFDNPYMALWKRLHDTYGTKVNCNIYYQCEGFNLTLMPDMYASEWRDNADWFRLTFHALQNDPAKPYIKAGYNELARDYEIVMNEILRFAGEDVTNTYTTVHWGEATVEGCRALRDRGVEGLCGYFMFDSDGAPTVSYYLDQKQTDYLSCHDYWMDVEEELIFIHHDLVANTGALEDIVPKLEERAATPEQRDVMEIMIHEQYFYPDYTHYLPDFADRCETAVRWMAENGYKPVFWSDGFLGVPE